MSESAPRSALAGSILAARNAGTAQVIVAITATTCTTAPYVTTSRCDTPYSIERISRVPSTAPATPMEQE
jgi:hypothetical protein